MAPTPVLLPGKSHGRRSLVGCSPWGLEESDMTEQLPCHFSLSCTGEGNGNPLSVLAWRIPGTEEPDGLPSMGSHSWTQLKWLSSSSIPPRLNTESWDHVYFVYDDVLEPRIITTGKYNLGTCWMVKWMNEYNCWILFSHLPCILRAIVTSSLIFHTSVQYNELYTFLT